MGMDWPHSTGLLLVSPGRSLTGIHKGSKKWVEQNRLGVEVLMQRWKQLARHRSNWIGFPKTASVREVLLWPYVFQGIKRHKKKKVHKKTFFSDICFCIYRFFLEKKVPNMSHVCDLYLWRICSLKVDIASNNLKISRSIYFTEIEFLTPVGHVWIFNFEFLEDVHL